MEGHFCQSDEKKILKGNIFKMMFASHYFWDAKLLLWDQESHYLEKVPCFNNLVYIFFNHVIGRNVSINVGQSIQ